MGQKAPQTPPKSPPFRFSIFQVRPRTSIIHHYRYTVYLAWGKGGKGGKGGWGAVDTPFPPPRPQANVRLNCSSNLKLFRTVGKLILLNRPTRQPWCTSTESLSTVPAQTTNDATIQTCYHVPFKMNLQSAWSASQV
eukprot:1147598-Pelagomonas_calceolata.AAC.10